MNMPQRKQVRLKDYDYKQEGAYFVTVCVGNRECAFGKIEGGRLKLNVLGNVAIREWEKTQIIRQDMNIQLDEFIVMPNHVHGIIIIGENKYNRRDTMSRVREMDNEGVIKKTDAKHCVPTNQFGIQSKNLSSIMRGYKSAVTMYARKNNIQFKWQARFYEHIVRNENDLNRIREYIMNNVEQWGEDEYFNAN